MNIFGYCYVSLREFLVYYTVGLALWRLDIAKSAMIMCNRTSAWRSIQKFIEQPKQTER